MRIGIVVTKTAIDSLEDLLESAQVRVLNRRSLHGMKLLTCEMGSGRCTFSYFQPGHWGGSAVRDSLYSVEIVTDFWRLFKRADDTKLTKAIERAIEPYVWHPGKTPTKSYESTGCSLDYGQMVFFDAEDLAEEGIAEAYECLLPRLRQFVSEPAAVREVLDQDIPSYSIASQGREIAVFGPSLPEDEGQSWARATYALFWIVNNQLAESTHKFYAINGGNDLGGTFLTVAECEAARNALERKADWPYLPTHEHPWYGQFH